jgi:hypothetical protein
VYFAIWDSSITEGPDVVGGLVICEILLPIVIAVAQTFVFTVLALVHGVDYLFLVFVSGYWFASLWDTIWEIERPERIVRLMRMRKREKRDLLD